MDPASLTVPTRVTVHFVGICTHVRDALQPLHPPGDLEPLDPAVRIVLVDASHGLRVEGAAIPPHSALLYIAPRFIAEQPDCIDGLSKIAPGAAAWTMSGVQLQLETTRRKLIFGEHYCLPSLTISAPANTFGPDPRVLDNGDLACVFRVQAGILEAYRSAEYSNAIIGKLTVESDDPEGPRLNVTRIWNQRTSSIRLRRDGEDDPHIIVANVGETAATLTDTEADFTLHYGVTTLAPQTIISPKTPDCQPGVPSASDKKALDSAAAVVRAAGLTFGCSNSTYP